MVQGLKFSGDWVMVCLNVPFCSDEIGVDRHKVSLTVARLCFTDFSSLSYSQRAMLNVHNLPETHRKSGQLERA